MTYSNPAVSASNNTGSSYQGIIDALNKVRADNGELPRYYPPNYQGIIAAILDLKKWGQAGEGDLPPSWHPIYDEDGNVIGGDWNPEPEDGTLWFDTRQGRLFVWMDDGFYQTNGADGIPAVQEDVPPSEVPGALWYNTVNGTLYLYDGQNWTVVGGATGVTNTMSLPLAQPTTAALSASTSRLPDTAGMQNQSDMNVWTVDALQALDASIGSIDTGAQIVISPTAPTIEAAGDLWFNSDRLELMVAYDNYWVPTAIPLSNSTDFVDLALTVEDNNTAFNTLLQQVSNRVSAIETAPARQLSIDVDNNENSINLNDSEGNRTSIEFKGENGIAVQASYGCISIDGSELQTTLEGLIASSSNASAVADLTNRTEALESNAVSLASEPKVTVEQFNALSQLIQNLPTRTEFEGAVLKNAAVFTGTVDVGGNQIRDVGHPTVSGDAANKLYVDSLRTDVNNTFVSKADSQIDNITIQRSDLTKPAIDFSGSHTNGANAFKFKTFGGPGTVTFGATTTPNEYAWEFSGAEEFTWNGPIGNVVSINHSGLATQDLFLGPNKIDVRERITDYRTALQGLRQALATANDFDEFKAAAHTVLSNI